MSRALATLRAARAFGIVREQSYKHAKAAAEAALAGGLTALEVSFTTPNAQHLITELRSNSSDGSLIGAGTILTIAEAKAAQISGAEFVVSPAYSQSVLEYCQMVGMPYFPGVLTPSEVATASLAGAEAVKLFPISAMRNSYLTDLSAPFPNLSILAVGGVGLKQGRRYLAAGATAIGIGSPLFKCPAGVEPWSRKHYNHITAMSDQFAEVAAHE